MTTGQFLDFLGVRMDASQTDDLEFVMNLVTPDNGEQYVVELSNSTLTNIEGFLAEDPDLTLTIREQIDVDSYTLRRYERQEKRWQSCLEDYRKLLMTDFEKLKASAQHGLTQDQAGKALLAGFGTASSFSSATSLAV
jgi:hypothetical protein